MAFPVDLFDDIIKFEIFSQTSLETFNSMRCANKEFDTLSYNPFLQSLRNQNTNQYLGFLMQKLDYNSLTFTHMYAPARGTPTLSVDFIPAQTRILCTSDKGLVVFERICPNTAELTRYHVAKPATSQSIAIPNPMTECRTLNISIVTLTTSPFRYKILRLSACRDVKTRGSDVLSPIRLELFDSRTWVWKEFEWVYMNFGVYPLTEQPIVVSGIVYVLFSDMSILAFNMYTEIVSSIVPPLTVGVIPGYYPTSSQLFKFKRSLGFARRSINNIWTFWVLQGGIRWISMHSDVHPQFAYRNSPVVDDQIAALRMSYNEYVFFKENNVVDTATSLHYKLFVFKSDNEPVFLNGRD